MDASGFTIVAILNQYDVFGVLSPVNFHSRKCSPAKENYDTHNQELFAILDILIQWRHNLEGANYKIFLWYDHKNLKNFQTSKVHSRRQERWL
jgi:hypothetical protein